MWDEGASAGSQPKVMVAEMASSLTDSQQIRLTQQPVKQKRRSTEQKQRQGQGQSERTRQERQEGSACTNPSPQTQPTGTAKSGQETSFEKAEFLE